MEGIHVWLFLDGIRDRKDSDESYVEGMIGPLISIKLRCSRFP